MNPFPARMLALGLLAGSLAAAFTTPATAAIAPPYAADANVGVGASNQPEGAVPAEQPYVRHVPAIAVTAAALPLGLLGGDPTPPRIANTYDVTTTADAGAGSLRAAITSANGDAATDLITFHIGSGLQTIKPATPLPTITQPVFIDGTTQTGYIASPLIEIDGSLMPEANGLLITAGFSTVKGLIINRFRSAGGAGFGIILDVGSSNVIQGNWVGLNAAGTAAAGNAGNGIAVFGASTGNLIGGTTAATRNVVSGNNSSGIAFATGNVGGNLGRGNWVGLNATGTAAVANGGNGIFVNAPNCVIGGTEPGSRNIVSANTRPGLFVGLSATSTTIQGNWIGTDATGAVDLGQPQNGIYVDRVNNTTIGGNSADARNVIAGNEFPNIYVLGPATGTRIHGNYIGTDPTGTVALGDGNAIVIDNAANNQIGGSEPGEGNLISGHIANTAVVITNAGATGNLVRGNRIGTNATGTAALPNFKGILVANAARTVIGGATAGDRNVISGNETYGIEFRSANNSRASGNHVGTDVTGALDVGNKLHGIVISASNDTIGGTTLAHGNIIAFNGRAGVYDSTGVDNLIRYNVLRSNGELGIDLLPRGLTKNDLLDVDSGANGLVNFPFLDSALVLGNVRRVHGRMEGAPNKTYRIDLFRNETCDPRHFGEAQEPLGETVTMTDGAGNSSFTVDLPLPTVPPPTPYITATATDPTGNTSELSQCLCLDDSDGDGLMDCWETDGWGIDVNHDGVIDLDLFARTARADHKDLFLEIDAMNGFAPPEEAIDMVVAAFAAVPNAYLGNPDGLAGINLQAEVDDFDLPVQDLSGTIEEAWTKFATIKDANFGSQEERESPNAQHLLRAKRLVYRYNLWARTYRDSSVWGIAEYTDLVTDDFMVTYSQPKSVEHQAGTLMHEFGHTLGLGHGGGDSIHYKPNYYSVMNYLWVDPEMPWLAPGSWRLDYSPVALDPLDESSLDETVGMNVPAGIWPTVSVPYADSLGTRRTTKLRPDNPVDWSGDGLPRNRSVTANISNVRAGFSTPVETLRGHADWSNLKYEFRRSKAFTWSGPSPFARGPVLLGEEDDPEPGPWLEDLLNALPLPRPEGWFVLDGQLDPSAPLVAADAGMSLYAAYRNGQLYVATQGAPTADVHILVTSTPPGSLQPAPRGKGGQVAAWHALLAELGAAGLTAWTNPQEQDLSMLAIDSTNTFLEGVIDVELLDGALPAQLFVAVGRYGSGPGGTLQAQVPAGNGDGNLDANEFAAVLVPTSVPGDPTAEPRVLALSSAWPNPTTGDSHLRFRLPQAAEVEATVHDVTGRRVGLLARGHFAAGEHDLVWNGASAGRRAPAGLYFVTLKALGERRSTRIVLLP